MGFLSGCLQKLNLRILLDILEPEVQSLEVDVLLEPTR